MTKNANAQEKLLKKHNILYEIEEEEKYEISASRLKISFQMGWQSPIKFH